MRPINRALRRLLKAALRDPGNLPAEAPFPLEIRVLKSWRATVGSDDDFVFMPVLRWASVCAGLLILISIAVNYRSLRDPGPNVLSLADSAIKMSMLP